VGGSSFVAPVVVVPVVPVEEEPAVAGGEDSFVARLGRGLRRPGGEVD